MYQTLFEVIDRIITRGPFGGTKQTQQSFRAEPRNGEKTRS